MSGISQVEGSKGSCGVSQLAPKQAFKKELQECKIKIRNVAVAGIGFAARALLFLLLRPRQAR